ncbi:hypothetical protein [Lentibacillus sp. Marseille-P4043]|uniref:hypothetical protein n=1 Tax=Lentibacillus sp. Marseille-P4043 TaxID=2040293 RepID=UPI0018F886A7|nr:hypothetical protein [Lentibacillus sp. Marseille-P4043]
MSEQLLQQMVNEIKDIKSNMAMKRDLEYMATKDDLSSMATKDDLSSMATKKDIESMATKDDLSSMATKKDIESMAKQIDRNFEQIVRNSEKLNDLSNNQNRHEKILETLSVRSIEQEGKIRNLKQV